MGHVKMMAAVQPFLSGAISKTVNMPTDATADEIANAYIESWKLGLKAVAVYRDGCKRTQPLTTSKEEAKGEPVGDAAEVAAAVVAAEARPARRKLPDERHAITHKFSIAGHEGYITVGMYEDGKPGEIFLVMAKEGSTISGLMDAFATSISMALQYGVPLEALVDKFPTCGSSPRASPRTPRSPTPRASPTTSSAGWPPSSCPPSTRRRPGVQRSEASPPPPASAASATTDRPADSTAGAAVRAQSDAPPCHYCGSIMIRNGSCYRCANCGSTSGCS